MCDDVHGGNILLSVCAVRVIGESDMMQDFLAAGDMEDVSYWVCYLLSINLRIVAYIYIRLLFVCFSFSGICYFLSVSVHTELVYICYFFAINVHAVFLFFMDLLFFVNQRAHRTCVHLLFLCNQHACCNWFHIGFLLLDNRMYDHVCMSAWVVCDSALSFAFLKKTCTVQKLIAVNPFWE